MTNQIQSLAGKWLLCGLIFFAFSFPASATDPVYENDAYLSYTVPPQNLPTIDAFNFINNNTIVVNFGAGTLNPESFETRNTLSYTNNGLMAVNAGYATNGSFVTTAPGCGFLFDNYNTSSGLHSMAENFANFGAIHANSILDSGNNQTTNAVCTINATNIVSPGIFDVGPNSLVKFTGKNVDLSHVTLTIDGGQIQNSVLGTAGFNILDEASGFDFILDWHPTIDLTPTTASGSQPIFFPPSTYGLAQQASGRMRPLTNSTAYFQQPFPMPSPTNVIVRAIFIQDSSASGVTHDTYFGDTSLGTGAAHVVWHGPAYIDPITGLTVTNYLILSDLYVSATNAPPVGTLLTGTPFTIVTTNTPYFPSVLAGFNSPGYVGFPPGFQFQPPNGEPVTNNGFAFVNVQMAPLSISTNSPSQNVTNYLAVLPGRVQISADSNLDLTSANIANPVNSGLNYLSLRAPYQFNGSTNAHIFSPYSDINLGVTNGNLTVTNLLEPGTASWSGSLQAWTSDWLYTDSTGVTWDFRVLLINSSLSPTTPSEVQDLTFHATNNLIVSDTFNILRKLSIDAYNLTLTTNGPDAVVREGELNLQALPITPTSPVNYQFIWQNSFPNLHNLTNSGAIRVPNVNPVNIGASASPYGAFINHGFFSDFGVKLFADNFESDGVFSNASIGSFVLQSQTAALTNGLLYAGGNISIAANSLIVSNVVLRADQAVTLTITNLLTDTGVTNANVWVVGTNATAFTGGINLPVKPAFGDLLGTTITNYAPVNVKVTHIWAGEDRGRSTTGYTNNVAIGNLILDALGTAPGSQFYFTGAGVSNAIYVDRLDLQGYSDYNSRGTGTTIPALTFNTNLVIYYADAVSDGADVSAKINNFNNGHLRWVPGYAGYFSSTNLVFAGQTNTFNIGLAQSSQTDSDGDGIANASDATPFFLPSMVGLVVYTTNNPANTMAISWNTVPLATNCVFYSTDLVIWQSLTNFISPQPYGSSITNVMVFDPIVSPGRYYQVMVEPWLTYPN